METASLTSTKQRNLYLMQIHVLAKKSFGEGIGRPSSQADEGYRAWLENIVQAHSCKELENDQLARVLAALKKKIALLDKNRGDNSIITELQLNKIMELSKLMGWEGLQDLRLRRFCRKTCPSLNWNVLPLQQVRREDATKIITGLVKWVNSLKRRFSEIPYESV